MLGERGGGLSLNWPSLIVLGAALFSFLDLREPTGAACVHVCVCNH